MKKSYWIIGIGVLIVLWFVFSYNSFVRANKAVDNQWAQVENEFQRRLDLIPNLVATVKGGTKEEQAFADKVTAARAGYAGAKSVDEKAAAASKVESAMSQFLITVEANPAIQTVPLFQSLSVDLAGTENRIAVERKRFNDAVTVVNTRVHTFPSNIIAKIFGFSDRTLFQSVEGAEKAPQVNF